MDIKLYSYLFGLFGTDGSVRRTNDGKHIYDLTLELIDKDIIDKIYNMLPNCSINERFRDTNFKKGYHSYILHCHNQDFILWCEQNNFPIKDKTNNMAPPIGNYSLSDFWRGVIDGDGSIGTKATDGQPFISLVTKSKSLKEAYCDYIYLLTGFKPTSNRNMRDNIFNITLHGEKALIISKNLYNNSILHIDRKYNKYIENSTWQKKSMKGIVRKKWTLEEVEDLQKMSNEDFHIKYPERTLVAIRNKRKKIEKEVMENVNK